MQSQLLAVCDGDCGWIMHELNVLPLITVTSHAHTHTHSSDFLLWFENRWCEEMEKTLPKRFHFISLLTEIHHNVRVFCGLVGGGSLPKEMQKHWLHFTFQTWLLGKFSLDECSGKVSVHSCMSRSVLLSNLHEKKLWNESRMLLFLLPRFCNHEDLNHSFAIMNREFVCVGVYSCPCTATVGPVRHICNGICISHSGRPRWGSW